jgi:gliding motility-associated-like protein
MISNFKLRQFLMFFVLLVSTFGTYRATASTKYTSAEIYADYIGTGPGDYRYRVTLVIYAACINNAPAFNTTEGICWASTLHATAKTRNLPLVTTIGTNPDTLDNLYCPSAQNSCRSATSTNMGIAKAVYSDTITLAGPDNNWQIEWKGGPRDNSVNLFNPAYNIDIRCQINNTGTYYNTSTPRYLQMPKFVMCYNVHNGIALSPYDPNGDSLYTTNVNSYTSPNTTVCFSATTTFAAVGYSVVYPIDASPSDPFTVNPYTGFTTVTPITNGYKYNIAYQTNKYDPLTNTNLGYCQRDMEYFVQTCSATPPSSDTFLANLSGATYDSVNHVLRVCPNVNFSFGINAYGGTANSAVSFTADNGTTAPGSNFVSVYASTTRADTMLGNFSWKPTSKDIGLHVVTFHVKDSACSGTDQLPTSDYSVVISVGYSPDAGPDQAYCPGAANSLPVQLNVTGVPPGSTFYWYNAATGVGANDSLSDSTAQNPTADPTTTTDYVVAVFDANGNPLPCKSTDTVRVRVFAPQTVTAGPDQTICLNQSVTLGATGKNIDSVIWSPNPTLNNDSISNPTAKPTAYGKTTYFANIVDVNGCHYFDSTHVITNGIAPKVITTITPDTVCPGGSAQLNVTVQEQSCGAATGGCKGTPADVNIDATRKPTCGSGSGSYSIQDPTPYGYYYYQGGNRMQIIYTKQELEDAGIKAGYINSLTFNVCSINMPAPNDSLTNFKIGMFCTTDDHFDPNTTYTSNYLFKGYTFTTVYTAKKVGVPKGPNTYQFSTPYYWDGTTNLAVQICYALNYEDSKYISTTSSGPAGNMVTVVPTSGVHCVQVWDGFASTSGLVDGCNWATPYYIYGTSTRPATIFNICQSTANYTYSWTPGTYLNNTNTYNPLATNIYTNKKYTVSVYANGVPGCTTTDTASVAVDTSTEISVANKDLILCRPGYTNNGDLFAAGRGNRPISNMACGTANPQNCPTPAVVSVLNGGEGQASMVGPFYYGSNRTQWIIPRSMLRSSGMNSGTIRSMDLNIWSIYTYTAPVFKNVEVRIGCTPKDSYLSLGDTLSSRNMTLVYTNPSLALGTGILNIPFTTPYSWDTTQNLVVQICYGSTAYLYSYAYTTTTPTNATRTLAFGGAYSDYCAPFTGAYSTGTYKTIPAVKFHYCSAPDGYFQYTWAPGLFLSDSTSQGPIAYIPNSVNYKVSTQGRNGCVVSDTVHIFVPTHHFSAYPADTAVCAGQKVTFHAKGGFSYQWYQNGFKKATSLSCNNCANPISSATDTTTYQVVVGDSVACYDTLSTKIEIKPIPVVKIVSHDTTIDFGSSVQLFAQGANVFTWSPSSTLSNPNIVNPIASPTEPVTYTVVGIAADGCYSEDSVHVNINYRGKLFVPSAFSPNGDGKNDMFNVANLTFEKILEFRVYNRWGQQVFEGTDNKGWDGKWKGVPQDLGSYEYLVRVGFPDGFVETFKGSVTLIR